MPSHPGLGELTAELLIDLIAALANWIGRALRWGWTRYTKPRPTRTPHQPPFSGRQVPLAGVNRTPNFRGLPYRKVQSLITPGESAIWYSLQRAVEGNYRLFCKVRLADVVHCPSQGWHERHWFRKIGRYHVDFVICHPHTTAPLLVVELDDRRHLEHARKRHDDFKDAVLHAAGLPIHRIAAQAAYDVEELKLQIEKLIGQTVKA